MSSHDWPQDWTDGCFLFFEDPWITGFLSEYVTVWPTRHDAQILNPVLHPHLHFLCHFCPVEASSALFVLHSHQHLLQHLLLSSFQPSSISYSEGRPKTSSSNKQRSKKLLLLFRFHPVKSSLFNFNLFPDSDQGGVGGRNHYPVRPLSDLGVWREKSGIIKQSAAKKANQN